MSKRTSAPAKKTGLQAAAEARNAALTGEPVAKKPFPKPKDNGRPSMLQAGLFIMPGSELVRYTEFVTTKRTLRDLGGPWEDEIVATSIADEVLSKRLQAGFEPITIQSLGFTNDGQFVLWSFGKREDGIARFKEIRHKVKSIAPGWTAEPPHIRAQEYDNYKLEMSVKEGWYLLIETALGYDAGGVNIFNVWIR